MLIYGTPTFGGAFQETSDMSVKTPGEGSTNLGLNGNGQLAGDDFATTVQKCAAISGGNADAQNTCVTASGFDPATGQPNGNASGSSSSSNPVTDFFNWFSSPSDSSSSNTPAPKTDTGPSTGSQVSSVLNSLLIGYGKALTTQQGIPIVPVTPWYATPMGIMALVLGVGGVMMLMNKKHDEA